MKTIFFTFLFCVLFYSGLLILLPKPAEYVVLGSFQTNQYTLEKYIRTTNKVNTVIVGSSLAQKLIFNNSQIYNMALSGDSGLTGLRTLVTSKILPNQVLIETNILHRKANEELLSKLNNNLDLNIPILEIQNNPMNLFLSYLYQFRHTNKKIEFSKSIRDSGLLEQIKSYSIELDEKVLNSNLNELKQLVSVLKQKNVDVMLFEMPVHNSLTNLARAKQIRKVFKATFPDLNYIEAQTISKNMKLNTVDGVHMTTDEAIVASQNLSNIILKH